MKITFSIEPDKLAKTWVVYTLADSQGVIQFVGCCKFSQLVGLPDARANALFSHIFPAGKILTVDLIGAFEQKHMARNALWYYIKQNGRPSMLLGGMRAGMRGTNVICNETGERFKTLTEACGAHGLNQSALSNHLSGRPGFATVRGKTYSRGKSL